jgi:hypothetical protein
VNLLGNSNFFSTDYYHHMQMWLEVFLLKSYLKDADFLRKLVYFEFLGHLDSVILLFDCCIDFEYYLVQF